MTGRYGDLGYPTLAKRSFLLGVGLFALGALGQLLVHGLGLQIPAWEATLLVDAELAGIVVGLFAPLLFGIVLPLTE